MKDLAEIRQTVSDAAHAAHDLSQEVATGDDDGHGQAISKLASLVDDVGSALFDLAQRVREIERLAEEAHRLANGRVP